MVTECSGMEWKVTESERMFWSDMSHYSKQKGHLSFQCKNNPSVAVRVAELPQEEILQLAQLSLHHLDEDAALMEEDFLQGKM